MLYYNTIQPKTLELLKALQKHDAFINFRLAGGTALALQIGHRTSIDIDLFGMVNLSSHNFLEILSSYGDVKPINISNSICICTVNGIKVDIVNYKYDWIGNLIEIDGIKLAHKKDIAAMKLAAITGRGSMKDFIDLYFLLKEYSLGDILNMYDEKYPDGSKILVLKSLSYFTDAENDIMPDMFKKVTWEIIKAKIHKTIQEYSKDLSY